MKTVLCDSESTYKTEDIQGKAVYIDKCSHLMLDYAYSYASACVCFQVNAHVNVDSVVEG